MAQGEQITLSAVGIRVSYKGLKTRGRWLDGVKRGTIKGFSSASCKRLRELLESKWLGPDEFLLGCTFTLPGKVASDDFWKGYENEFLKIIHSFRRRFEKLLPSSVMIYRVELQQRGAPHIHAIVRLSKADQEGKQWGFIGHEWLSSVDWMTFPPMTSAQADRRRKDFFAHGVQTQWQSDGEGIMRYLCDHASKSKQAQLGWSKRQWGIIGKRRLLVNRPKVALSGLQGRDRTIFFRYVRRLERYRKNVPCVFGSKLVGGHRVVGTIFSSPAMIRALCRILPPHLSKKSKDALFGGVHRMSPGQNARQ